MAKIDRETLVAMREAAAKVCQRMIAVYSNGCDGPSSDDAWAANALESARSQILCLPLASQEGSGC